MLEGTDRGRAIILRIDAGDVKYKEISCAHNEDVTDDGFLLTTVISTTFQFLPQEPSELLMSNRRLDVVLRVVGIDITTLGTFGCKGPRTPTFIKALLLGLDLHKVAFPDKHFALIVFATTLILSPTLGLFANTMSVLAFSHQQFAPV